MDNGVGVFGATSLVGRQVLSELVHAKCQVLAYSRKAIGEEMTDVTWRQLGVATSLGDQRSVVLENIADWVCLAPIWTLIDYLPLLHAHGVRRVVALSSTSRFTKGDSLNIAEQETVNRLTQAEAVLQDWAKQHAVTWVILRPTLIYGLAKDKNITEIARFIRRFGFFPVFGRAQGLRQPVHACDVAHVCVAAILSFPMVTGAYNLSGAEVLTYREMVRRVFKAWQRPVRILTVPLNIFQLAIWLLQKWPRYRHWNAQMAMRMNQDMVFDHAEAVRDLAFNPRPFALTVNDIDSAANSK